MIMENMIIYISQLSQWAKSANRRKTVYFDSMTELTKMHPFRLFFGDFAH